jgi:hypothetical protein
MDQEVCGGLGLFGSIGLFMLVVICHMGLLICESGYVGGWFWLISVITCILDHFNGVWEVF